MAFLLAVFHVSGIWSKRLWEAGVPKPKPKPKPRHLDGCLMLVASSVTCMACNNAMNCGDVHLAMRVGRQVDFYVSTTHDTFTSAQLSVSNP